MQVKNEERRYSRDEIVSAIKLSQYKTLNNVSKKMYIHRRTLMTILANNREQFAEKQEEKLFGLLQPYLEEVHQANKRANNILEAASAQTQMEYLDSMALIIPESDNVHCRLQQPTEV